MSRVLIVSGRGDWSAEQVAKQLDARGYAYSWLDPADFPQRVRVMARLGHDLGRSWCGEVETPDGVFSWEEISAVFYRRPRDFDMPSAMSGPEQRFARAQARVGLGGVLVSLPVKWINHPSALDFIVTADTEDYVFLECNAAGQWGWLAEECGLPIAEAIADELIGDNR